jgi:hypothetical protein
MRANEFIFENQDNELIKAIRDFLPIAIEYLQLEQLPEINFEKDVISKHQQPTFGVYHHDTNTKTIALDIDNRHPIDIVRTLAHELVHFKQDLEGRLSKNSWKTGSPTENEAHDKSGIMMRIFDKQFPKYLKAHSVQLGENFVKDNSLRHKKLAKHRVHQTVHNSGSNINYNREVGEDQHPNERPMGPETKPTMPAGTVRVDVSDVYDWYKLGQHISDLKGLGHHDFGKGPPSTIFAFGSEEEEHKYIKDLEKLGLTTTDIDPVDPNQPKNMKRQKTDPTYNVGENFADGKNPGRRGLAKRSGVNTKASVSDLRRIAKNSSGEKARMAHWLANMKSGKKKQAHDK